MHLGEGIVEALPISERLVQRRVEAVQKAELELVSALKEILQLRERERDVRCLPLRVRLKEATLCLSVAGEEPLLTRAMVEEGRPLLCRADCLR